MFATSMRDAAGKQFGAKYGREVFDFLQENYVDYDLNVIRQKGGPGKIYCSQEDYSKLLAANEIAGLNFGKD